jgi:hypothetical protein
VTTFRSAPTEYAVSEDQLHTLGLALQATVKLVKGFEQLYDLKLGHSSGHKTHPNTLLYRDSSRREVADEPTA